MFTPLLVAAMTVAAPVPKAAAPELKWRLAKGDTFYAQTVTEAVSAVNAGPGVGAQGSTSAAEFVYKATVLATDEKGTTLEVEFLSCKSGSGNGGGAVKLDDQKGVVGKKMTFTLDAAHKVTKAVGLVDLANAGGLFSAEYVQSHVQDLMRAVPGKPLGKGDTWKGEEELPLADGIVAKRVDRGTVTGTEDGLTKLEVETDNAMGGGPKGGGIALDLKGDKGKRTVLFDSKAGRVRKLTENYTVAGSINIGNAGGGGGAPPPNITVNMTMKTATTVSDEQPKDGK